MRLTLEDMGRTGKQEVGGREAARQAMEEGELEAHAARHGLGFDLRELGAEEDEEEEVGVEEGGVAVWRAEYYQTKLAIEAGDEEGLRRLVQRYAEGIAWCYAYYYRVWARAKAVGGPPLPGLLGSKPSRQR